MRTIASIFSLIILLTLQTGCMLNFGGGIKAHADFKHSATYVAETPVIVETSNGRIDVVEDSASESIEIAGRLTCVGKTEQEAADRLAAATISVEADASGRLVIRPIFPDGHRGSDGASFSITLPAGGAIELHTSNGSIHTRSLSRTLKATTSNGRIEVLEHDGSSTLRTSNGSITVMNHTGSLEARTSNGPVQLEDVHGSVEVHTSNGSIVATLDTLASAPVNLDTANAQIRLTVGGAFAGTFKLSTSNGRVHLDDPHGRATEKQLRKRSGTVTIGDGGPMSRLATSNGSIVLTVGG